MESFRISVIPEKNIFSVTGTRIGCLYVVQNPDVIHTFIEFLNVNSKHMFNRDAVSVEPDLQYAGSDLYGLSNLQILNNDASTDSQNSQLVLLNLKTNFMGRSTANFSNSIPIGKNCMEHYNPSIVDDCKSETENSQETIADVENSHTFSSYSNSIKLKISHSDCIGSFITATDDDVKGSQIPVWNISKVGSKDNVQDNNQMIAGVNSFASVKLQEVPSGEQGKIQERSNQTGETIESMSAINASKSIKAEPMNCSIKDSATPVSAIAMFGSISSEQIDCNNWNREMLMSATTVNGCSSVNRTSSVSATTVDDCNNGNRTTLVSAWAVPTVKDCDNVNIAALKLAPTASECTCIKTEPTYQYDINRITPISEPNAVGSTCNKSEQINSMIGSTWVPIPCAIDHVKSEPLDYNGSFVNATSELIPTLDRTEFTTLKEEELEYFASSTCISQIPYEQVVSNYIEVSSKKQIPSRQGYSHSKSGHIEPTPEHFESEPEHIQSEHSQFKPNSRGNRPTSVESSCESCRSSSVTKTSLVCSKNSRGLMKRPHSCLTESDQWTVWSGSRINNVVKLKSGEDHCSKKVRIHFDDGRSSKLSNDKLKKLCPGISVEKIHYDSGSTEDILLKHSSPSNFVSPVTSPQKDTTWISMFKSSNDRLQHVTPVTAPQRHSAPGNSLVKLSNSASITAPGNFSNVTFVTVSQNYSAYGTSLSKSSNATSVIATQSHTAPLNSMLKLASVSLIKTPQKHSVSGVQQGGIVPVTSVLGSEKLEEVSPKNESRAQEDILLPKPFPNTCRLQDALSKALIQKQPQQKNPLLKPLKGMLQKATLKTQSKTKEESGESDRVSRTPSLEPGCKENLVAVITRTYKGRQLPLLYISGIASQTKGPSEDIVKQTITMPNVRTYSQTIGRSAGSVRSSLLSGASIEGSAVVPTATDDIQCQYGFHDRASKSLESLDVVCSQNCSSVNFLASQPSKMEQNIYIGDHTYEASDGDKEASLSEVKIVYPIKDKLVVKSAAMPQKAIRSYERVRSVAKSSKLVNTNTTCTLKKT